MLASAIAQCRRLTHFERYADEQPDWQGMPQATHTVVDDQ
jgi:hypothetical protein